MASTRDVLDHHIKCFGESDFMGILSDYLREIETGDEDLVDQNRASWNQLALWLRQIDGLRRAV